MDAALFAPPPGSAAGHVPHVPVPTNSKNNFAPPDDPRWPTLKEAKALFEFFNVGSRTDLILLGDLVEVKVHYVKSKNHKILCTAATGSCESCLVCGTSPDVSFQQTEYHAPAARKEKDRRFHQCVAVFTNGMGRELLDEHLTDAPARGHRFELFRRTSQKSTITMSKASPRTLALAVPQSFDVLPWIRARFCLIQDAARPATRFESFVIRDCAGPSARPKPLDITASDAKAISPEEYAKTKAVLEEGRKLRERWEAVALGASATAPTPPAPIAPAPIAEPAPTPTPPATPTPEPAPLDAGATEAKKPGDLAISALVNNPANYLPPTFAGVGTADKPLIDAPVTDGRLLTRPSIESLADRRKKARHDNSPEARAAAAEKGASRLVSSEGAVGEFLATIVKPGTNGTHAAGGEKGGA